MTMQQRMDWEANELRVLLALTPTDEIKLSRDRIEKLVELLDEAAENTVEAWED